MLDGQDPTVEEFLAMIEAELKRIEEKESAPK